MDQGTHSASSMISLLKLNFDGFDGNATHAHDVPKEGNMVALNRDTGLPPNMASAVPMQTPTQDPSVPPLPTPTELIDQTEGKRGWPKGKKRRKISRKDTNAPKPALTGYVRFLSGRREKLRELNPAITFAEITKILGAEWSKLAGPEKQTFLDEAEKDKERYNREIEAYQKTDAYKSFQQQQLEKRAKNDANTDEQMDTTFDTEEDPPPNAFEIPIFTEEFLDHNKGRETELRQLRRQTTELEEQNAILSKHIDNMKSAIGKLEVEAVQTHNTNIALQQHLALLRETLTANFASLPGIAETPTLETIDSFMSKIHTMILESPQDNEALITTVRDIVSRLNFDGEKS